MMKRVFISHTTEEAHVAERLKVALTRDFLGLVDVFVSSDGESIGAGEEWLTSIEDAIRDTSLLLILCSPDSIKRPWINFEAGAAWILRVPLIPVCHAGLTPRDLRVPLSLRQGVSLSDPSGMRRLYERVAGSLEVNLPPRSFEALANEVSDDADRSPASPELERERMMRRRMMEALEDPRWEWRTLERIAAVAGVTEDLAADLLLAEDDVRFGKNSSGHPIVGLRSRIGD